MGAPSLENTLMEYWAQLNVVQQESIVSLIKSIVQPEERTNLELYNREIDEAMKRIDEGRFIAQEDLEKEAEQW